MYCVKRNGVDERRAYVYAISIQGLTLSLPDSKGKWKDKYFYVGGDIWSGELVPPVHATWNHNFDTTIIDVKKC